MRTALTTAVLMVLAACTSQPPAATGQILDPQSGNTLFVATKPLVFARERTDVAAHARDYATLVAVAVDESGKFSEYVLLHRWSTVDRRMVPPPDPNAGELRIVADGRAIDLVSLEEVPISLTSRPELHGPKHGDVITRAYQVDLPMLRFLAASRTLVLRMPQESFNTPFFLWRDERVRLAQFVEAQGERDR